MTEPTITPYDYMLRVNETLPGSSGGPIEALKRAFIVALREAFNGGTLDDANAWVHIDMEYPMEKVSYPAIWVRANFTKLNPSGVGHELLGEPTIENEGQPNEWKNWEPIREWMFEARITMTVLALSSLQRDRISDALVTMLSFSRPPENVLTDPTRDTKQFRQLITSLRDNPYISVTLQHGELLTGGQSETPGVPWDEKTLAYEDNISIDCRGEYNIIYRNDGTYTLRAIEHVPILKVTPYDWQ